MSRCFPYPPPGYEPRPGSEHRDLLKKERHEGKKHRKKKNKEKGERKGKDRGHKKLKREKQRERRKNKDRDKHNHQRLEEETQKNDDFGKRRTEERGRNEVVKDTKPTDVLVAQFPDQEVHANDKVNRTSKLLPQSTKSFGATASEVKESSLSRKVKKSGQATQHNHEVVQKNNGIAYTNRKGMDAGVDSNSRIKNGKSHQVGSAEKHSNRSHSSKGVNLPKDNYTQRSSESVHATRKVVSGAGRGPNGRITPSPNTLQREEVGQHSEISVHSNTKGLMGKENQSSNNHCGNMDLQLVQSKGGAVEGEAKIKEVKSNYCKGVKGKDRYQDVTKRKPNNNNKMKQMEKNGNVNEQNKVDGLVHLACLDEQKFASDDVRKRKDLDADSSLHECSMRTTKLPRVSSANIICANGKISPHSPGIVPYLSAEQGGTNTQDVEWHKPQDGYSNGIIGSHFLEEYKASVSSSSYDSNNLKPPHPDTKYLSQVRSIPPREDFTGYIDQDWLFSEGRVERKTATFDAAESHQVWSDAQLIDSTDVVALPYVVPL